MLTKQEIINHLHSNNKDLFTKADSVRKEYVGDEVHLRGLIEFSNICKQTCYYCGLRKDNHNVTRYRLSEKEIIEYLKFLEIVYNTYLLVSPLSYKNHV